MAQAIHSVLLPASATVQVSTWSPTAFVFELLADRGRALAALALCAALGGDREFNAQLSEVADLSSARRGSTPHVHASVLSHSASKTGAEGGSHKLAALLVYLSSLTKVRGSEFSTADVAALRRESQCAVDALCSCEGQLKDQLDRAFWSSV